MSLCIDCSNGTSLDCEFIGAKKDANLGKILKSMKAKFTKRFPPHQKSLLPDNAVYTVKKCPKFDRGPIKRKIGSYHALY